MVKQLLQKGLLTVIKYHYLDRINFATLFDGISLMQSGGLYVHEMSRGAAYDAGIVMAPLYMIMRLSKEEIALWVEIMEERKLDVKEDLQTTRWKMFIDSCRVSHRKKTIVYFSLPFLLNMTVQKRKTSSYTRLLIALT
nr:unnamed protein product [Callosobruchus chinensis]